MQKPQQQPAAATGAGMHRRAAVVVDMLIAPATMTCDVVAVAMRMVVIVIGVRRRRRISGRFPRLSIWKKGSGNGAAPSSVLSLSSRFRAALQCCECGFGFRESEAR